MTQYYSALLLIPFLGGLVLAFFLLRPATRKILPTFAVAIAALAVLMGVAYSVSSRGRAVIVSLGLSSSLPEAVWFGLTVGVFTAAWFLLLAYIYGDAKRRQMPAVAWVIAAILIPNLSDSSSTFCSDSRFSSLAVTAASPFEQGKHSARTAGALTVL